MRYTVPGTSVKLLAKAVHSLARVGDDIYIEPAASFLSLRAVNSSRSAYATYNFASHFFSHVEAGGGEGEEVRCKVMVRSLLLAFRSISVLEKTVEWCRLETGEVEDRLVLVLRCRHGVTRTFRVGLVECEPIQAVYSTEACSNSWTVHAKVLQEANGNFLANQEEVTLHVTPETFSMSNFTDECVDEKKMVHTELSMHPNEFVSYTIGQATNLTFCLKELKSLITFTEQLNLPITAHFTAGGCPLVLAANTGAGVSCTYVLATLAEPGVTAAAVSRSAATAAAMPRVTATPAVKKTAPRVAEALPPSLPQQGRHNSTMAAAAPGMDSLSLSAIPMAEEAEEMGANGDTVVVTPPAKRKKRQLFKRCYDATFHPGQVPGAANILAPDSDEES